MSTTREANKEARREAYQRHLEFEADLEAKKITDRKLKVKTTQSQRKVLARIIRTAKGFYSYTGDLQNLTHVEIKQLSRGAIMISFRIERPGNTNGLLDKHLITVIGRAGGTTNDGNCLKVTSYFTSAKTPYQRKKFENTESSLFRYEMNEALRPADRIELEARLKARHTELLARHPELNTTK